MDLILIPGGLGRMKSVIEKGLSSSKAAVQSYRSPEEAVKLFVRKQVSAIVLHSGLKSEHLMPLVSLAAGQGRNPVPIIFLMPNATPDKIRSYVHRVCYDVVPMPWEAHRERLVISLRNALVDRERQLMLALREQELAILDEVGKTIISTLELKKVLNIIMQKTKELVRSEAWSILLVDENNEDLLFSVAMGSQAEKLSGLKLKIGQGIAGWVAREGKPIVVQNVMDDPRFYAEIDLKTDFLTKSVLCVPLESRGRILGVIEVVNKMEGGYFTDHDLVLVTKLAGFAAVAIDNARLYHQTKMLSLTDELTKLYNARFFNQFLDNEIRRCQRYSSHVALIFLDLDYFKMVNDHWGHLAGSKVLIEVAGILKGGLREVDIVARYGGDEFLIILPETPIEDAGRVAERIRKAVENNVFLKDEGLNIKLTASFGVSAFPKPSGSKEDLIRKADQAMYKVKNMNRNGVWVADLASLDDASPVEEELS